MKKLLVFVSVIAIAVACSQTLAHEAGSVIVRGGIAHVSPNSDSDVIDVAGLATLSGVEVESDTQLGITATYMLTDNVGVELLASTPFEHEIRVENTTLVAGTTKHLPPTVSLQYYFNDAANPFRPYLGAGINTTIFFSEDVSPALNAALDTIVALPAGSVQGELELDQSWGFAVQAGFDYKLNDAWGVSGTIWYVDIHTDATVKTAVADVSFGVDIDPWVYMLGISCEF